MYELTGDNHKDMEYRVRVSFLPQPDCDVHYVMFSCKLNVSFPNPPSSLFPISLIQFHSPSYSPPSPSPFPLPISPFPSHFPFFTSTFHFQLSSPTPPSSLLPHSRRRSTRSLSAACWWCAATILSSARRESSSASASPETKRGTVHAQYTYGKTLALVIITFNLTKTLDLTYFRIQQTVKTIVEIKASV